MADTPLTGEKTDYNAEAAAFVARTGVTLRKVYQGHRPYFDGDTEQRAVWQVTIERPGRHPYTFTFGQSIAESYQAMEYGRKVKWNRVSGLRGYKQALTNGGGVIQGVYSLDPVKTPPTDYDILACLEKGDVGSFEDFCADFGYDTDSRKALKTYLAVQAQAAALARLFTPEEREALPS